LASLLFFYKDGIKKFRYGLYDGIFYDTDPVFYGGTKISDSPDSFQPYRFPKTIKAAKGEGMEQRMFKEQK
jgi:hypothetical protein